jgi:acyl carrier protein
MKLETKINEILSDIMDIDEAEITPESYVIRDLGAESIDLLELAVVLNDQFDTEVNEDAIFLRTLRRHLDEAGEKGEEPVKILKEKYSFLPDNRIDEILSDLDAGPVLKVKDMIFYMAQSGKNNGNTFH